MMLWLSFWGCGDGLEPDREEKPESTETDTSVELEDDGPAPLTELSSGQCPDMSETGLTSTFLSSDEERVVTVIFPENPQPGMGLRFWFHGIGPAGSGNVTASEAWGLGLQSQANATNSVFMVPEAGVKNILIMNALLWSIEDGTYDKDLVLYDDLRSCAALQFDIDLNNVSVAAFSGGSLFVTILMGNRGDTLATVGIMSGGSDIEFDMLNIFEEDLAPYTTSTHQMPVLLISGQEDDIYPPDIPIFDFYESSNRLEGQLRDDGHAVARCLHDQPHLEYPGWTIELLMSWVSSHQFGQPSTMMADLGDYAQYCQTE